MKTYRSYIDVHHHYNPLSLLKLPGSFRQKLAGEESKSTSISRNLDAMEKLGIAKCILSYPVWFPMLTEQENFLLCMQINECYASLVSRYPCLGAFALLPASRNPELELKVLEYALDTLQLDGIVCSTHIQGLTLCSPEYTDLLQELEKRSATVFLHPACLSSDKEPAAKTDYETMAEITKATCGLVFDKMPRLFPHIRFILPCGGGNTSFFFQNAGQPMEAGKERDMTADFKRLYYDTAFPNRTNLLECLERFADREHILYGSDFPFASDSSIQQRMYELEQIRYKDHQTLADYTRQNASFIR